MIRPMFRTGKALASTLTRSLGAVLAGVFLGMPIYDPIRLWGEAQSSRNPMRSSRWTHRYDESGRVFLAGCSPAEPASASSTFQHIQKQSSTKARRASKTAAGLDVQKIALGKPREEFFS